MFAELRAYEEVSVFLPRLHDPNTEATIRPILYRLGDGADGKGFQYFLHLDVAVPHAFIALLLLLHCTQRTRHIVLRGDDSDLVRDAELSFA